MSRYTTSENQIVQRWTRQPNTAEREKSLFERREVGQTNGKANEYRIQITSIVGIVLSSPQGDHSRLPRHNMQFDMNHH